MKAAYAAFSAGGRCAFGQKWGAVRAALVKAKVRRQCGSIGQYTDTLRFKLTALPIPPSVTLSYPTGMISADDAAASLSSSALQSDDIFSTVSSNLSETVRWCTGLLVFMAAVQSVLPSAALDFPAAAPLRRRRSALQSDKICSTLAVNTSRPVHECTGLLIEMGSEIWNQKS